MAKVLFEKNGQKILTTKILIGCLLNLQKNINRYSYKVKKWRNARSSEFDGGYEEYRLGLLKYKKNSELITQVLSWYYDEKEIIRMVKSLHSDEIAKNHLRANVVNIIERDDYIFEK
jgi:hypothetical protein